MSGLCAYTNTCAHCCVDKASGGLTTAPPSPPYASHSPLYIGIGTAPPSPPYSGSVEEVRIPRGSRDPRLSAGIGPLPVDDDIPIASTSGHVPFDEYRSSLPEPTKLNPVTSLKELVCLSTSNYTTCTFKEGLGVITVVLLLIAL